MLQRCSIFLRNERLYSLLDFSILSGRQVFFPVEVREKNWKARGRNRAYLNTSESLMRCIVYELTGENTSPCQQAFVSIE